MPLLLKKSTLSLICLAIVITSNATARALIDFNNGHKFAVTQLCTDKGHIRPVHPIREICSSDLEAGQSINDCPVENRSTVVLKKPILQLIQYDLGEGRELTKVERLQTQNIPLSYPGNDSDIFSPQTYSIPSCPNSLIQEAPQFLKRTNAQGAELVLYTALFQKGVTLIRAQSEFSSSLTFRPNQTAKLEYVFQTPQCSEGKIEFTEEFIQYLDLPQAQDFLFRRIGGEGSGNGKLHPELNLRLIGGEGSGSGRIVWGGEGSGSGRALEGRTIDPQSTSPGGDISITIELNEVPAMDQAQTAWLDLIEGLVQEIEAGEQVPSEQIQVECRK
jgi:hypothetical protein